MRAFQISVILIALCSSSLSADDTPIDRALANAGSNREQIQRALDDVPADQKSGMEFLIQHMPGRDLNSLTADFLLKNVRLAYQVRNQTKWGKSVPDSIFLNNVLPYASINERRDDWREDFHKRFFKLIENSKSPSEATAILNNRVFKVSNVRYSRKRRRAVQSPYESMETGLASCTGLSIMLIDACRAVGVPARFVGTPLWSDKSGNHSWVEVWDNDWHFTGAAEPTGADLDRAWFIGRASKAKRDDRAHAIYAVSYRRTPLKFPMVWSRKENSVFAVNVTDRYTKKKQAIPDGYAEVMLRAVRNEKGEREAVKVEISDDQGNIIFAGSTKDESFDGNDHLVVPLKSESSYVLKYESDGTKREKKITVSKDGQLETLRLNPTQEAVVESTATP